MNVLSRSLRLLVLVLCSWLAAPAAMAAVDEPLHMLVFVTAGCPHCEAQKPFLQALADEHEPLQVTFLDLREAPIHLERFRALAAVHGTTAGSVPTVFVGGRAWVGDGGRIRSQIAAHVRDCVATGDCPDSSRPDLIFDPPAPADDDLKLELPLLGSMDLGLQPLALATLLIAFVDGFNPCSLWVLTILLALVIHSGSRRRILIVGLTFLTVTAALYGLFITGVFGVLDLLGRFGWIYGLVAVLALAFALVNIKDYFYFQRGLSFTIDEAHKPGIYRRIRGLLREGRSTPALMGATAMMAAGIAVIELPCTAGFPVLWSALIGSREVGWLAFAGLLGLYLLVYLAIELVIFAIAVVSLRVDRFQEHHGRLLKLLGGMVMLALALVLMFAPGLMQDLSAVLAVFGLALAATALVMLLHRRILPVFGIRLGDQD